MNFDKQKITEIGFGYPSPRQKKTSFFLFYLLLLFSFILLHLSFSLSLCLSFLSNTHSHFIYAHHTQHFNFTAVLMRIIHSISIYKLCGLYIVFTNLERVKYDTKSFLCWVYTRSKPPPTQLNTWISHSLPQTSAYTSAQTVPQLIKQEDAFWESFPSKYLFHPRAVK